MGIIAHTLRTIMEAILWPFDLLGPFWGLTLLSILTGIGMLWVVGKTTPQKRVEAARDKMDSAIYEIRLFIDYPKRVFLSLGRLIKNSLLYIAYMLPAFVLLAIPLGMMYLCLEARHGLGALPLDTPLVLSVELDKGAAGRDLQLELPDSAKLTAPLVYVKSKSAVYARLELHEARDLKVKLRLGDKTTNKSLVADPEVIVQPQRAKGSDLFLSYGAESPLAAPFRSISIDHPTVDRSYLGIDMPWWLWWLGLMMVAAFGLRKRLGVTI